MALIKMPRTQVRFGVPTLWDIYDAEGQLLLARGGVVEDDEQLVALMAHGPLVNPEEVKAALAAAALAAGRTAEPPPPDAKPSSLFGLWEKLLWRHERALKGMNSEPGFPVRIDEIAHNLGQLMERDADIGIFLAVRQDQHRFSIYGLSHSLYTAMLCYLMGRRMGWAAERVSSLVKAALTMNAATLELQGNMAAQGVPMLPEQEVLVREHPLKGAQMLRDAGVTDEEWLSAVAQHHEWTDGSGYPQGLTDMTDMARALKHADVFMAKITPRVIHKALTVQDTARQLFKLDAGGPMAIIKEFGIYPPGEFVKLKSGELAVVLRRTESANAPMATSVTDKSGMPVVHMVRRDTARPEYAITGLVADKQLVARLSPERLYGLAS